jgi:hypothetical protein
MERIVERLSSNNLCILGVRSVAEQRYQAVLAVIGEGGTVYEVAGRWGVIRQL